MDKQSRVQRLDLLQWQCIYIVWSADLNGHFDHNFGKASSITNGLQLQINTKGEDTDPHTYYSP